MSSPVRLALLIVALVVLATAAIGAAFYANPVGIGMWMARSGLERSGLDARTVDAPPGPQSYFVGGAGGRTVVLLHGIGNQAGSWVKTVADLQESHRVVAVDLAGHGDSAPADGALAFDDTLAGLDAVLGAVSPEAPVTLVGNSMGAWVALLYAERWPHRVEHLLLLNGGGLSGDLGDVTLLPADRQQMLKLVRAISPAGTPDPAGFVLDDLVEKIQAGATRRQIEGIGEDDLLDDRLAAVTTPAEVFWGLDDSLTGADYGRRLAAALPDARFHGLEGCGHIPQQQCPQLLLRQVLPLLDAPPPAARPEPPTNRPAEPEG